MNRRRIIYFFALLAAVLFYIFDSAYFSWILLLIFLTLPFLSLMISLPFFLGIRPTLLDTSSDGNTREPDAPQVVLRSTVPLCAVRVRVTTRNLFTGETHRRKLLLLPGAEPTPLPYSGERFGLIQYDLFHTRAIDLSGLWGIPTRRTDNSSTLLVPPVIPFPVQIDTFYTPDITEQVSESAGRVGEREFIGAREYKRGDALRDIHWKLTARSSKLISREFQLHAQATIAVGILWTGNPERLSLTMGRLEGLCLRLLEAEEPHTVYAAAYLPEKNDFGLKRFPISQTQDIDELQRNLLGEAPAAASERAEQLLFERIRDEKITVLVTPDACILYRQGRKEDTLS